MGYQDINQRLREAKERANESFEDTQRRGGIIFTKIFIVALLACALYFGVQLFR